MIRHEAKFRAPHGFILLNLIFYKTQVIKFFSTFNFHNSQSIVTVIKTVEVSTSA